MSRIDFYAAEAERQYIRQEEANEAACVECAARNGHTAGEADMCDDGNVGCPDCPFKVRQCCDGQVRIGEACKRCGVVAS